VTEESEKLRNEINQREELLIKLNSESALVNQGKDSAAKVNEKLFKQMNEFRVPDVSHSCHCLPTLLTIEQGYGVRQLEGKTTRTGCQSQRMGEEG
jgi:hypothetical protein